MTIFDMKMQNFDTFSYEKSEIGQILTSKTNVLANLNLKNQNYDNF